MTDEERKLVLALANEVKELRIDLTVAQAAITRLAEAAKTHADASGHDGAWIDTILGRPITIPTATLRLYPWLEGGDRHLEKDALALLDPVPGQATR